MEGVNLGAVLLCLLAALVCGVTSLAALCLLIARRTTAALRTFAGGVLFAAAVVALAVLSFLENGMGFHDEGTEPLIVAMASSVLLAGTGQFVAALKSPRTYAASLGCAASSVVLPLIAAGLADGSVHNIVAMGWVLTSLSLILAGASVTLALIPRSRGDSLGDGKKHTSSGGETSITR